MSKFESVLTTQQQQQFETGIHHIFSSWTAVQLAIENSLLNSEQETREAFAEVEQNIIKVSGRNPNRINTLLTKSFVHSHLTFVCFTQNFPEIPCEITPIVLCWFLFVFVHA